MEKQERQEKEETTKKEKTIKRGGDGIGNTKYVVEECDQYEGELCEIGRRSVQRNVKW